MVPELMVKRRVAVRWPVAVGLKATRAAQDWPGARLVEVEVAQLLPAMRTKSVGLADELAIPKLVRVTFASLLRSRGSTGFSDRSSRDDRARPTTPALEDAQVPGA